MFSRARQVSRLGHYATNSQRLQSLFSRHDNLWAKSDRQEAHDSLKRLDETLKQAAHLEFALRLTSNHLSSTLRELEMICFLLETGDLQKERLLASIQSRITHSSDDLSLLVERLEKTLPTY